MSELDYWFKETSVDPSLLDSRFPAPRSGRPASLRSRMRKIRRVMEENLTPRQKECLELY